jgi:Apea-like HEPN
MCRAPVEKSPENIIVGDSTGYMALLRALTCMRLVSSGDVTTGPMWATRSTKFETGRSSGVGRSGWPTADQGGGTFRLTPSLVRSIRKLQPVITQLYEQFSHLPKSSYKGPGNLDLALRSFDSTYDRFPRNADSQLLDCITAAEAMLSGDGTSELTFKLSFRMASMLGRTVEERKMIFQAMKVFYDARSKTVHGATLSNNSGIHLQELEKLRKLFDGFFARHGGYLG